MCLTHFFSPVLTRLLFFILSDDGRLHKAINANDKMHIIEEMVLFPGSQRVQHIELDSQRVSDSRKFTVLLISQPFLHSN